jgi:GNAT superfamily N-acetyltransferase
MELKFLADVPEAIPQISQWYFDEWGHKIKDNSVEKISERIRGMLNRDRIPLHILAVENNKILGVSQLKIREMEIYPEKEHWLGGVYVDSSERHRGLASVLVSRCLELAKQFRVATLYLQTERLDGGLYAHLGWRPIEKVHYNGLHVLVMENKL